MQNTTIYVYAVVSMTTGIETLSKKEHNAIHRTKKAKLQTKR